MNNNNDNKKYKHSEGERVYFELDEKIKGFGIICGSASDDLYSLGRSWIVRLEPPISIDTNFYPFSCINVFECFIREPPNEIQV